MSLRAAFSGNFIYKTTFNGSPRAKTSIYMTTEQVANMKAKLISRYCQAYEVTSKLWKTRRLHPNSPTEIKIPRSSVWATFHRIFHSITSSQWRYLTTRIKISTFMLGDKIFIAIKGTLNQGASKTSDLGKCCWTVKFMMRWHRAAIAESVKRKIADKVDNFHNYMASNVFSIICKQVASGGMNCRRRNVINA